jgi:thioredoxin 1
MARRKLLVFALAVVLVLGLGGCLAGSDGGGTTLSLEEALASGIPALAEFGLGTCIPCRQMKPVLEQLAEDYEGRLKVVIVSVDERNDLARQYGITLIPTQVVFDGDGNEVSRHVGFWPSSEIISALEEMALI